MSNNLIMYPRLLWLLVVGRWSLVADVGLLGGVWCSPQSMPKMWARAENFEFSHIVLHSTNQRRKYLRHCKNAAGMDGSDLFFLFCMTYDVHERWYELGTSYELKHTAHETRNTATCNLSSSLLLLLACFCGCSIFDVRKMRRSVIGDR
eukprot:scaffold2355_cov267-Chaetoceros_neogracile.AAC.6